ncbi:hypothetical protein F4804DRAFT_196633 [Jackrogersella minutella]|nr:hypothetical protein F4804DRAFT_196633 [Jackrogersella minutella]
MSQLALTTEQEEHLNDTRQPALWGCLIAFLIINDVAIAGRLWGTWRSLGSHSLALVEDVWIVLSGIFVNAIIANLMVATHYGLGLHTYTVNERDGHYPSNLSKAFRHIWITMVLMSGFFICVKMTLLFFYKRLFLVSNSKLRIFWWANFVYIVLWFFGGTAFYLFQCKPVQWYFLQYYARYHQPVPGDVKGQCDATSVLHVSLPVIFNLISDVGLLILPIWAISKLRLDKNKKRGLIAVFGIGVIAALLELARILALLIDTDDKTDPSYGVSIFLILTAAEETTAVVCACVPIVSPLIVRKLRAKARNNSDVYDRNRGQDSSGRQSSRGFKRVVSFNHIWTMPTTTDNTKVDTTHDDGIPLTIVEIIGSSTPGNSDRDGASDHMRHQSDNDNHASQVIRPNSPTLGDNDIHVRTDIIVQADDANQMRGVIPASDSSKSKKQT